MRGHSRASRYRNVRLPISGCASMVAYRFSLHATPPLAATAAGLSSRGPRYMVQAVNSREGWLHLVVEGCGLRWTRFRRVCYTV